MLRTGLGSALSPTGLDQTVFVAVLDDVEKSTLHTSTLWSTLHEVSGLLARKLQPLPASANSLSFFFELLIDEKAPGSFWSSSAPAGH